ncbi:hypothetical protein QUF72_14705 [Desulfobacterales bacterium HSG2]|nr:hypothetical protein [Desulfobacterales bacterium HSG2]
MEYGSDLAIRAERAGYPASWKAICGVWLGFGNPSRAGGSQAGSVP